MRTVLIASSIILLAAGCAPTPHTETLPQSTPARVLKPSETIIINGHELHVQIARTPEEHAQGLSGIQTIADNQGMLFLFDPPTAPTFWMKDMRLPLDIVWIRDGVVVDVIRNIPPPLSNEAESTLPLYRTEKKVSAVLEINTGNADLFNIKAGTTVIRLN
jgi:uncharacterized membrane protein (UPF0127 family)